MTREEAKQLLPIIQAFAEGKTIQYYSEENGWIDWLNFVHFNEPPSTYRIKSEPKFRPFKTQEECWQEMMKHQPFGWVKEISSEIPYLITSILDEGIAIMEDVDIFEEAINSYEFKDGTPFGIKEE